MYHLFGHLIIRPLAKLLFTPIGYAYMRLRYGPNHKRILIEKYNKKYHHAGFTAVASPILIAFIIIMTFAVSWVYISLALD